MEPDAHRGERAESLRRLCAQALDGDMGAYETLHDRLAAGLRAFFSRRLKGNPELVEELSQRTWVAAWDALRKDRYDPDRAAFTTFLYGVGYKIWLQHLDGRREETSTELDVAARSLFDERGSPDAFLAGCEQLEAVRECLMAEGTRYALTGEERTILEGVAAGLSERDLAEQVGCAPSTLNVRKQRAMHKLRMCLTLKGFGRLPSEQAAEPGE